MGFSRLAYGVLVPPMQRDIGGNFAAYGTIGSANFVGYLVGTLLATALARRPDRVRTNGLALATMCAAMAASGAVGGTLELGVLRFVVGVASGIALALTLALAVEGVPPQRRGLCASIVWAGGALGVALVGLSAVAAPLGLPGAWRYQWLAMGLVGGACALVFVRLTGGTFAATERRDDGSTIGLSDRRRYLALTLAYFAYGFGYIVLGLAGMAGAIVWGPLVDRFRSGAPIAAASALCAAGALGVASGDAALAIAGALAVGVSFIGVPAMIGALLQQREPAQRYPRAFASMTVVLGVGQILGPVAGGLIADRFGAQAAVRLGAAALVFAALGAARYRAPASPRAGASAKPMRQLG
jgi:MFS family permease